MLLSAGQIATLDNSYNQLLELCDELEALADALPDQVDLAKHLQLIDQIEPIVARTSLVEERILFPLLEADGRSELKITIERLRREHLADRSTAEEVGDLLRGFLVDKSGISADAIGYLLRSFFESLRRHVHGERELVQLLQPRQGSTTLH